MYKKEREEVHMYVLIYFVSSNSLYFLLIPDALVLPTDPVRWLLTDDVKLELLDCINKP